MGKYDKIIVDKASGRMGYDLTTDRAKSVMAAVDRVHARGEYPGAIRVMRELGKTGPCRSMNGRDNYARKHRLRELKIPLAYSAFDEYDWDGSEYGY
mgnify:CR=1 FL=1